MNSEQVLEVLTEMFGGVITLPTILTTMKNCNGELDACIECLLGHQGDRDYKMPQPQVSNTDNAHHSAEMKKATTTTSTGAIKKVPNETKPTPPVTFTSFPQRQSSPAFKQSPLQPRGRNSNNRTLAENAPHNFSKIVDAIDEGYRIMVLMRGPPGCGKSHLAKALVDKTVGNENYRNHIFSADDYFMVNGVYKFQGNRIDEAHRFTQSNVLSKARDGWSPIVVDNTNMKCWEMYPYVQMAADNGYCIELLEPVTYWKNNPRTLAVKNAHGVPESKIKIMLNNFDRIQNVSELYKLCKLEHAISMTPRMRHYPIREEDLIQNQTEATQNGELQWAHRWEPSKDTNPESEPVNLKELPLPKPPRILPSTSSQFPTVAETSNTATTDTNVAAKDSSVWTLGESWPSYDEESVNFWGQPSGLRSDEAPPAKTQDIEPQPQRMSQGGFSFLLSDIKIPSQWKDDADTETDVVKREKIRKTTDNQPFTLVKHRRGCQNENSSFSEICNVYPQIPAPYLWDLFEKCNGDGDWVANLLLEEEKLENFENATQSQGEAHIFKCNCDGAEAAEAPAAATATTLVEEPNDATDNPTLPLSLPRDNLKKKERTLLSESAQHTKKLVESTVTLGSEHYSEHLQKIRFAKGIISREELEQRQPDSPEALNNEKDNLNTDSEVTELTLGMDLVQQLHAIFKTKHCSQSLDLENLPAERTKVFMATEMAEQLYLLVLDAMYSYEEEEKLFSMQQDARMARLIETKEKYPALFKQPNPSDAPNLKDVIEMECAMQAYQAEMSSWATEHPQNLALTLSLQKLTEMFPAIEQRVLAEILAAHNNRFDDTVNVLNNSIPEDLRKQMARENEDLLKQKAENEEQKLLLLVSSSDSSLSSSSSSSTTHEEAINLHLRTAQECRNLAQHHLELKNECHEKSRNAIQRGVSGVADYYSQIARLHRTKIDMYNNKASNCIMEVHKLKINNKDIIDLHYLHSEEALRCLKIFLSEHASKLRRSQLQFKDVFIITGRGLHSADGIPIIKQRVKSLLRNKKIGYIEVNPGFLKVRLHNKDALEQLLEPLI